MLHPRGRQPLPQYLWHRHASNLGIHKVRHLHRTSQREGNQEAGQWGQGQQPQAATCVVEWLPQMQVLVTDV